MPLPPLPRRLAACAVLACASAGAQPRATTEILRHPGSDANAVNSVSAINDAGWVSGNRNLSPWLYKGAAGYSMLPVSGTPTSAFARDINEAGWLVGTVDLQPAVWRPGTPPVFLANGNYLTGINNSGWTVGQHTGCCTGVLVLSMWRPDGTQVPLSFSGPGFPEVLDINDQQLAVGYSGGQALRWQPDGSASVLPWNGLAEARAINNRGVIVGRARDGTAGWRTVMWDAGGQLLRSFEVETGSQTWPFRINDANQAVGSHSVSGTLLLWNPNQGRSDLGPLIGGGLVPRWGITGINNHAQIVGQAYSAAHGGREVGYILTLHPDWQGGSGHWDDGQHWNWAGTGVAPARLGAMHDVVINPGQSATVFGAFEARVRTLQIGGTPGQTLSFNLNGGQTRTDFEAVVADGGVLRGGGTLATGPSGQISVAAAGRVQVNAGELMTLATPVWQLAGLARLQGSAFAPAQLQAGDFTAIAPGGRLQMQWADAAFGGSFPVFNRGQISLQDSSVSFGGGGLINAEGGQLAVSFGRASIDGPVYNSALVVVSNGGQASFLGAVVNDFELRISSGGAANFFGQVSGGGAITGGGEARFEGGLSFGASPGQVTVDPQSFIGAGSSILMELGGTLPGFGPGHHDKIVFNGLVTLEGGALDVVWWDGIAGQAGDRYDLFDWNGGLSGRFGALHLPGLAAGLSWNTADLYAGGTLAITAVPEPPTWALWVAALGLAGLRLRAREIPS